MAKYVWANGEMILVMHEQAERCSLPRVHGSIDWPASNRREVRGKGHTSEPWSIHAFQIRGLLQLLYTGTMTQSRKLRTNLALKSENELLWKRRERQKIIRRFYLLARGCCFISEDSLLKSAFCSVLPKMFIGGGWYGVFKKNKKLKKINK